MASNKVCEKLYGKGSKAYKACVSAKFRTSDPATARLKKLKKEGKSFSRKSPFSKKPRKKFSKRDIMGTGGIPRIR